MIHFIIDIDAIAIAMPFHADSIIIIITLIISFADIDYFADTPTLRHYFRLAAFIDISLIIAFIFDPLIFMICY
jgi:hypothetical protein